MGLQKIPYRFRRGSIDDGRGDNLELDMLEYVYICHVAMILDKGYIQSLFTVKVSHRSEMDISSEKGDPHRFVQGYFLKALD